jgi:hypothetical protein
MIMIMIMAMAHVNAHTWMLSPEPRYADTCIPIYDSNTCCADAPTDTSTLPVYERGQHVNSEWGRNNHIGGFIRYSILPIGSDTSGFDSIHATFQYACFSSDCVGYDGSIYSWDGSYDMNAVKCSTTIIIPVWLEDGAYTIQWRWHSGGDSYDIRNLGLVDFTSCHDFVVRGGAVADKPRCPLFVGGDADTPELNTCEFFKSNGVNACTDVRDCFGWFAKSPPKEILECPTNVLGGGRLVIGESGTPITNPETSNVNNVDINGLVSQFTPQVCT